MYCYIYDTFLKEKKFNRTKINIENRLTDLGLNGKIIQLTILNNATELLKEALHEDIKTIVAVGDDQLATKIINVIADQRNLTLGIIPVGENQKIGDILGIPKGLAACETLSSRIVKTINLGKINEDYFLNHLVLPFNNIDINFDEKFCVKSAGENQILEISNLHHDFEKPFLEAAIHEESSKYFFDLFSKSQFSLFKIKKAVISSHSIPVTIDDQKVIKTPALIEVVPKKLNVIVGKNRKFGDD